MKKFSTELSVSRRFVGSLARLSPRLLLAGLACAAGAQALPEYRQWPQPRPLPVASRAPIAGDDAWPQVIVLDEESGPTAVVAGRDGARLFIAGEVVRLAPALEQGGARRLPVYRPGPWLAPSHCPADTGRLAVRVGTVEARAAGAAQAISEAMVVRGSGELAPGDLVPHGAWPRWPQRASPAHGIAARVARRHGDDRMGWTASGQVHALDRGAGDGVRRGMCVQVGACTGGSRAAGRILHAGAHASAVLLDGAVASLESGDEVCIAACPAP
ncbi:hypothetical protein Herbaro_21660 [Herbaspirillum sp. WKF16]|uniref:hypothetical protein n=1 Tax=Herbaspirillum sp. WKF16 TaxID=3028312 RepID=UPI0023A9CA87|nr:hypothetical protein [Herbaspirillum sp. WKF16]WDZ96051.1 hypothetical protein Herbaro_21660 [Herbaspirillum sp. WKF16]